jgi:hypothetical protein
MFHTKFAEKIKAHFVFINLFFSKMCCLSDNVVKYCTAGQTTDDNMAHAHCVLDNSGSEYVTLIALPLQQWIHERALMLRYTYIGWLV